MKTKELKNIELIGYPFVDHVKQSPKKNTFDILSFFDGGYHSNFENVISYGCILLMGYRYDLTHILKKYIAKTEWGIYEYYAPNKTLLRKNLHQGRIYYILEIDK